MCLGLCWVFKYPVQYFHLKVCLIHSGPLPAHSFLLGCGHSQVTLSQGSSYIFPTRQLTQQINHTLSISLEMELPSNIFLKTSVCTDQSLQLGQTLNDTSILWCFETDLDFFLKVLVAVYIQADLPSSNTRCVALDLIV